MMDRSSFSSELEDGAAGLSLSLVSYGSDLDASVGDGTPNLKPKTPLCDVETVCGSEASTPTNTTLNVSRQRAQQFSITGLSEKKKKEVEVTVAEAAAAEAEYLATEEIFRALDTVISSDELPQPTRDTVKKLWLRKAVQSYIGAGEGTGLLGLSEEYLWIDCQQQLSETDLKILRLAVEKHLFVNAQELKQTQSSKQGKCNFCLEN